MQSDLIFVLKNSSENVILNLTAWIPFCLLSGEGPQEGVKKKSRWQLKGTYNG